METQSAIEIGGAALGMMTLAMGSVMIVSDQRSRMNSYLFGFICSVGLDLVTLGHVRHHVDRIHPSVWARLQGLTEAGAFVFSGLLVFALLASSSLIGRRAQVVRILGVAAIVLGFAYALAAVLWPAQRLNDYALSAFEPHALTSGGFWLFAPFYLLAGVIYLPAWALIAFGGIDAAEERRAAAWTAASVMVIAATAAPWPAAGVLITLWLSLGMYGHTQYVAARAQRGVFLSRFLSPRVTEMVDSHGLEATMRPRQADLTVVCADLRGFTSYSEGVPSQAVVDLLAEYYDAIGNVVSAHGGTITNYAGDGVLVLVGAPLSDPDHAATGLQIARDILVAVQPVLERWETRVHRLGLGVGVASGKVTVGAISAETRMEYTAIGMAVNLAARLCAAAAADEVLIDAESARTSSSTDLAPRGEMTVKGFSDAQLVYSISRADG